LKQGTVGFENQINKCLELADYLYAKIKNREEFEMVFDGEVGCPHGLDTWCFQEKHQGSSWSLRSSMSHLP
jgi:glutamate/tyrosine decarboxylase-like PLP-dependent enzyme